MRLAWPLCVHARTSELSESPGSKSLSNGYDSDSILKVKGWSGTIWSYTLRLYQYN